MQKSLDSRVNSSEQVIPIFMVDSNRLTRSNHERVFIKNLNNSYLIATFLQLFSLRYFKSNKFYPTNFSHVILK